MFDYMSAPFPRTPWHLQPRKRDSLYLRDYMSLYVTICFHSTFYVRFVYKINNFSNTRSDFWKNTCTRYVDMRTRELKAIRRPLGESQAELAASVRITTGRARHECGKIGISESVARLVRLVERGVKFETVINKNRSRRDCAAKRTKSSNAPHPKS
jgi:hypothetical protein